MINIADVKPQIPNSVNNVFVWQLYQKAAQMFREIIYSDSANASSGLAREDLRRSKKNLDSFSGHLAEVEAQIAVPLDYPEFKKDYLLKPLIPEGDPVDTDNSDVLVLADYFQTIALIPVTSGQTLKTNSMYHPDDLKRLKDAVEAAKSYLDYLDNPALIPLDLVASTSQTPPIYPPANVTSGSSAA